VKPFEEESVYVKVWTHLPPITHLSPIIAVVSLCIILLLLLQASSSSSSSSRHPTPCASDIYRRRWWCRVAGRRTETASTEDRTAAAAAAYVLQSRGTDGGRRVFDDGRMDAVDIEFRARSYLRRRNHRRRISPCHRALSFTPPPVPPHHKRGPRAARENKHDATFIILNNILY